MTALSRAQRSALVRITTAYRTVAYQALCVLAGRMPAHLKVRMWERIHVEKIADRDNPEIRGNPGLLAERASAAKKRALSVAMREWQESWDAFDPSNWTWRLISSVRTILGEGGLVYQLDY